MSKTDNNNEEKKMTKADYIDQSPRSYLAANLAANEWPADQVIEIIGGLDAPGTRQSNLYKALSRSTLRRYTLGGHRQRGTEGWWIAVA